jgi:hypothetical protein
MAEQPSTNPPDAPLDEDVLGEPDQALADEVVTAPRRRLSFWDQAWVQNLLPMFSSLGMHLLLLGGGLLLLPAVIPDDDEPDAEVLVVADASFTDDSGDVGGLINPGLNDNAEQSANQNVDAAAVSDGFAESRSTELADSLLDAGGSESTTDVIGAGVATGDRLGGSAFGGGNLAPFGRPGGGGTAGPAASIFGTASNLKSVAYVCDASGSMGASASQNDIPYDTLLERELRTSIGELQAYQKFGVYYFSNADNNRQMFAGGVLKYATTNNKREAGEFIDTVEYSGATQPISILRQAFQQKPQLLWLLTDGAFRDPDGVIAEIDVLNADRSVRVNTILFLNERDTSAIEVLETIAERNGGVFRHVTEATLSP